MSGMFNLLLDKASAASDAVIAHRVDFQLNSLLQAVGPALKHRASEQGARLRIVPCHERIHSDPALLKQLLSVLTDSALAHNEHGRLLIGCRRHDGWLRLEVRGRASGVTDRPVEPDLTDARRLSAVLGHQLHSCPGSRSGMVYAISIALDPAASAETLIESAPAAQPRAADHRGIIMIVEDDADLLKLLGGLLRGQGYAVALALNSAAALSWIYHSGLKPDLILADLHLGIDMNGLELIATLRSQWRVDLPAIVLTGDVSNATALAVAAAGCTQLNKPAKLKELIYLVHSMFADSGLERAVRCDPFATPSMIFVVDDDQVMRDTVRQILQADGYEVRDFATCEGFLRNYAAQERACLLIEARLPDGDGVDVLRSLRQKGDLMPIIVISASNDIAVAVAAMKAGAWDFIEKPCDRREMLSSIERALGRSEQNHRTMAGRQGAIDYIATLTARQRQIMDMVLAGHPSKNIAAELGISQRTVENHRASIMTRTHSRSIPALARLALAATLQVSTAV
jgi:two-component system CheB/CheR fusion protein